MRVPVASGKSRSARSHSSRVAATNRAASSGRYHFHCGSSTFTLGRRGIAARYPHSTADERIVLRVVSKVRIDLSRRPRGWRLRSRVARVRAMCDLQTVR